MPHKRLFVPGPVEVAAENLAALARPQIGHRSPEYAELHRRVVARLQGMLGTTAPVFLFTCSSTGVWEAAIRNAVRDRVLCCMQGAFSDRWFEVAGRNGKAADALRVPWGKAIRPEAVDAALAGGRYDAVTVVHNETSTGVMNDLGAIAGVVRRHPGVTLLVDAVSSMSATPIPFDAWGIDVCLSGTQKAFALPPGLAIAAVSERALEKARSVPNRGYYFDFLEMKKHHDKGQTPATPATPQIQALDAQLDSIAAEGLEARYARHAALAAIVQEWARERFALFSEEGFHSPTVTCVANTRGISVAELNRELGRQWVAISNGYGDLKEKTFRIAHMGDTQEWEVRGLLEVIDRIACG
ncbi:MAG TPA: alanine--glyoxylate aminotransferase family protein [Candidatus Polarisedimenticolaceae bacterium]